MNLKDAAVIAAIIGGLFLLVNTYFDHWLGRKTDGSPKNELVKTEFVKTETPTEPKPGSQTGQPPTAAKPISQTGQDPAKPQPAQIESGVPKRNLPAPVVEKESLLASAIDRDATGDIALVFTGNEPGLEAATKSFLKGQGLRANSGWVDAGQKMAVVHGLQKLSAARATLSKQFHCLLVAEPAITTTKNTVDGHQLFTASGQVDLKLYLFGKNDNDTEVFPINGLTVAGGTPEKALQNLVPIFSNKLLALQTELKQCAD